MMRIEDLDHIKSLDKFRTELRRLHQVLSEVTAGVDPQLRIEAYTPSAVHKYTGTSLMSVINLNDADCVSFQTGVNFMSWLESEIFRIEDNMRKLGVKL